MAEASDGESGSSSSLVAYSAQIRQASTEPDAIEGLGIRVDFDPAGLRRCLDRAGFCFIFAPAYHPAMARVANLRRALGIRTLFNLLGPLVNPARPSRQVVGVSEPRLIRPMAEALDALGVEHAMVVHGQDGMDEISISAPTRIAEVHRGGAIREYEIAPEEFGLTRADQARLKVSSAEQAVGMLLGALAGGKGAAQDVLALNAGAAIYVAGAQDSLARGVEMAAKVIASGRALKTIEELKRASQPDAAGQNR